MSQGAKNSGGRNIVAYFAGHLANLVNGGDTLDPIQDFAEVKPYALYEKVRRTLTASPRYLEGLVGFWSYPPPNEAEDAADFYFDQVLQRPIAARRGEADHRRYARAVDGRARAALGQRRAPASARPGARWSVAAAASAASSRRKSCSNSPTASSNASTPPTAPTPKCCGLASARRSG